LLLAFGAVRVLLLLVELVQFDPLIRREHLAHVQQHQRAHLVHVRSDRFDFVDLPRDDGLVRIRRDQARQLVLLRIEVHFLGTQRRDRRLEDRFDTVDLIAGQRKIALKLRVAPPGKTERLSAGRGGQRQ
jgi:hypothetical protein